MDTQLGIEWMTMFDGPWTDGFQGVARTANGFLVTGVSQSFLPLGTGFAEKSLAVMHLPFEGLLSFLPATNARATVVRPWTLLQMSAAGASVAQPLTVIDAVHAGPGAVLELPAGMGPFDTTRHAEAMYRSIFHWRPLLNGSGSYWPVGFPGRRRSMRRHRLLHSHDGELRSTGGTLDGRAAAVPLVTNVEVLGDARGWVRSCFAVPSRRDRLRQGSGVHATARCL